MICYLVRHGKDDDTIRGGWSDAPLTEDGIEQVKQLAICLMNDRSMNIGRIYTSDLLRAKQTAGILSSALRLDVEELPAFRETNNGILAGMKNSIAAQRFPGLYWGSLEWDEHYPGGESPHSFFDRISDAWFCFKSKIQRLDHNVILVTHGGVINVIRCIEDGITYSNKLNPYPVKNAEVVKIEI